MIGQETEQQQIADIQVAGITEQRILLPPVQLLVHQDRSHPVDSGVLIRIEIASLHSERAEHLHAIQAHVDRPDRVPIVLHPLPEAFNDDSLFDSYPGENGRLPTNASEQAYWPG